MSSNEHTRTSQFSKGGGRNVAQAQRSLEKVLERQGCTKEGIDWMMEAVDPFHDAQVSANKGFPDGTGLASVLLRVKNDIQISAPANLLGPTYCVQIALWPWLTNYLIGKGDMVYGYNDTSTNVTRDNSVQYINPTITVDTSVVGYNLPMLTCWSGEEGFDPLRDLQNSYVTQGLAPNPMFTQGNQRVVSVAFEVRSVGPDLYKSGTLYIWRQPTPSALNATHGNIIGATYSTGASSTSSQASVLIIPKPPTTSQEVVQIPTTVTLEARQGAYVVGRFNSIDPPVFDSTGISPVMLTNGLPTTTATGLGLGSIISKCLSPHVGTMTIKPNNAGAGFTQPFVQTVAMTNFDMSGVFITGLNPQDTLTVSLIVIIERFPDVDDKLLNVIGTSSPCYDPKAIQIYSDVMCTLPVGCEVRENGLGGWFKEIASVAMDFAPTILEKAGPKGMVASKLLSAVMPKKEKKKVADLEQKVTKLAKEVKKDKK